MLKLIAFFLTLTYLSLPLICLAEGDHENALVGTWEDRQANGKGFDDEGELIEVTRNNGHFQGFYFGLDRAGEHGLFYTAVELKSMIVKGNGEVSFTVPERGLFMMRPTSVLESQQAKFRSAGFTRDELKMEGSMQGNSLTLRCTSMSNSCPEDVMVFQKGQWPIE